MELKLTNSAEKTLVDKEIFDLLKDKKISVNRQGYAQFNTDGKLTRLSRYIFKHYNPDVNIDKLEIDHINQNKLDNQINNLRACTGSLNKLNTNKSSKNTSGIKNINYNNTKKKWCFNIALNDRLYSKEIYNTKYEALYALKYLVEQVATEEEKEFLYLDEDVNFDNITDIRKEIIKADIDNYIEKTNKKKYKTLSIKSDKTYIHKNKNKFRIQITIFNKKYNFGLYSTIEDAKPKRDLLVELFNEYTGENLDAVESIIKNSFESEIVRQNIYKILNKKIDNN